MSQIYIETERLYSKLEPLGWTQDDCRVIAPMTLEINELKREQDAIILAHSYQTPDIMYGVADHVGDSYGLSITAMEADCDKIIFCSVHFMGETAKILSPEKEVYVPAYAGCTLAASITAENVRELKQQHPGVPVVTYVNTTAEVKAESDVCVTSSNVVEIINKIEGDTVIFIPDKLMGENLKSLTDKEIITWDGTCIVHEKFDARHVDAIRLEYPNAKILAHPECSPSVVADVDFIGSTGQILRYIGESEAEEFMIASECGLADRMRAEFAGKTFVGACSLCPFMKTIQLKDVLQVLQNPREDQRIVIEDDVLRKAQKSLQRMVEMS